MKGEFVYARSLAAVAVAVALFMSACSDDGSSEPASGASATNPDRTTTTSEPAPASPVVFNGQGNDLAAYLAEPPFTKQIVIPHHDDEHPDGLDINGQICFDPRRPERFVAGEDTLQDTTGEPGWGIFELSGTEIGKFSARELAKLVPTYQKSNDNPENYGCGFLADGRILTTDIGNQAEGDGDGQLIVWFPPFNSRTVKYCKVDIALATGQGILVDGNSVYVAQARPPKAGIWRYDARAMPTTDTPAGGCNTKDTTGAPMTTKVKPTRFIEPGNGNSLATPNAIAKSPKGTLYVSSVFNGVIAEFTAAGKYVRDILRPPAGEQLGAKPFSTGTPLGVGVGPDGSVYYADIGIVISADGIGPGRGTGKVRRIAFDRTGKPLPPEEMDKGLAFPDGIGVWEG
jgi:sugar lactone lactonase YvrE